MKDLSTYYHKIISLEICLLAFGIIVILVSHQITLNSLLFFAICSIFLLLFSFKVFLIFPSERINPLFLLGNIYQISLSFSLLNTAFSVTKDFNWTSVLVYYDKINYANLYTSLLIGNAFSFFLLLCSLHYTNTTIYKTVAVFIQSVHKFLLFSILSYFIVALQIILILTGKYTFEGIYDSYLEGITVDPLLALVSPFVVIPVFYFSQKLGLKEKQKAITIAILCFEFVWFFLTGRRSLLYFGIIFLMGFYNGQVIKTFLSVKNLIKYAIAFFILSICFTLFNLIRYSNDTRFVKKIDFENVNLIFENLGKSDVNELRQQSGDNLITRPLSTLSTIAKYDKVDKQGFMVKAWGQEIYGSVLKASPSDIFVKDKASIILMETLFAKVSQNKLGDGKTDLGDSLIIESLVDFGYLGIIIYPIFISILCIWLIKFAFLFNDKVIVIFSLLSITYCMLTLLEGGIANFFLVMRNLLVINPIIYILYNLFKRADFNKFYK